MGKGNDAMTALMDSIRAKSGVTGKLGIVAAKQAVDSITTGGGVEDLPYRRYTGQITETIKGAGVYAVLAKNNELAEHRNDEDLMVLVTFDIASTPNTVVRCLGFNSIERWMFNTTSQYQYILRCDASGARSVNNITVPVNTNAPTSVGCIQITADGELLCYANSANYAIRPCNYEVEVMW